MMKQSRRLTTQAHVQSAGPVTVEIVAGQHIDAGIVYLRGDKLTVDETTAAWLIENSIAAIAEPRGVSDWQASQQGES